MDKFTQANNLGMAASLIYENSIGQLRNNESYGGERMNSFGMVLGQEKSYTLLKRPQEGLTTSNSVQPLQQQTSIWPVAPANRTPLAFLHEICLKTKALPSIDVTEEGPVHNRTFECFVKVEREGNVWTASAKARNKKDAKHEAARALLLSMDQRMEQLITQSKAQEPSATVVPVVEYDPEVEGNPIGELNDVCMKARLHYPEYQEIKDQEPGQQGPPSSVFTYKCSLTSKTYEIGRGPNKKHAKRVAANKVLQRIIQAIEDPTQAPDLFPEFEHSEVCRRFASLGLKEKQATAVVQAQPSVSITSPKSLKDIIQSIKTLQGSKLDRLMKMKLSEFQKCEHVVVLDDISEEQKFKLDFMDFLPYLDETKHKSILCLESPEVSSVIFIGSGSSTVDSRKAASYYALDYLRLTYRNN